VKILIEKRGEGGARATCAAEVEAGAGTVQVHGDGGEEIDAERGGAHGGVCVCVASSSSASCARSEVATAERRRRVGALGGRTRSRTNGWERVAWPAIITASSTLVYLHIITVLIKKMFLHVEFLT
jgi:hypothetical protein